MQYILDIMYVHVYIYHLNIIYLNITKHFLLIIKPYNFEVIKKFKDIYINAK